MSLKINTTRARLADGLRKTSLHFGNAPKEIAITPHLKVKSLKRSKCLELSVYAQSTYGISSHHLVVDHFSTLYVEIKSPIKKDLKGL